ncbi:MAG: hypothetical protein ACREMY_05145 [bacterium]
MLTPRIWAATVFLVLGAMPLFAQSAAIAITKSFTPSVVTVGGTATTAMTVTITNPNAFQVTGINFSDTYPAGLAADQVGAYTCGTLGSSAAFSANGWTFTNVTLGAGASCSVPMLMHATIPGVITNTTSQVTGTGVPGGGPASATLNALAATVASVPTLSAWMLLILAGSIVIVAVGRMRM